jgi:hypothetical protein
VIGYDEAMRRGSEFFNCFRTLDSDITSSLITRMPHFADIGKVRCMRWQSFGKMIKSRLSDDAETLDL